MRPFQICAQRGKVAYQLEIPSSLSTVHNVFHVSQLMKCPHVPTEVVPLHHQHLLPDLTYCEHPIHILEEAEHKIDAIR